MDRRYGVPVMTFVEIHSPGVAATNADGVTERVGIQSVTVGPPLAETVS